MKLKWNGIEWGNEKYIYWFDPIKERANRLFGYEKITYDCIDYHALCFWWFCICWSI